MQQIEKGLLVFVDSPPFLGYPYARPGGTGAAESVEPRQVREEATVRWLFRAPPANLPGHFISG